MGTAVGLVFAVVDSVATVNAIIQQHQLSYFLARAIGYDLGLTDLKLIFFQ